MHAEYRGGPKRAALLQPAACVRPSAAPSGRVASLLQPVLLAAVQVQVGRKAPGVRPTRQCNGPHDWQQEHVCSRRRAWRASVAGKMLARVAEAAKAEGTEAFSKGDFLAAAKVEPQARISRLCTPTFTATQAEACPFASV